MSLLERTQKSSLHKRLHAALQKYPIVRIAPNWLAFGRSQAARDIYGYNSKCVKAATYDLLSQGGANLNNISDKRFHSSRRRMVAPKNIQEWEPKVAVSVADLMNQIDARCAEDQGVVVEPSSFDAVHWIFLFSVETVIKIMLSKDVFFLRNGTDHVYFQDENGLPQAVQSIHNSHASQRAAATVIWDIQRFALWIRLTKMVSKRYADNWAAGPKFHAAMEALTKERIEQYSNGERFSDLFQPMLEDKHGEASEITLKDRIAEVEQAVGAGTDGPAVSISMTLYYLIRNPHTFAALRKELDTVLSTEDSVAPWGKVKSLPFLRACIDEAMRLAPPVATELIRRTPPDRHVIIDGHLIPPDTNVSIAAYTSHRDPQVFPDPETYNPDRWMAKGSDNLRNMLGMFIPFSAGTRGCIGRNVSILMQSVCVATLVYHYDFALPHENWEMEFEEWFSLWPLRLPLGVRRREPASFPQA
ncbi:cytochrome P450 [Aspergillus fischeri NRRL 181]|uniref:Benzoate 4-monooxygenase cytochrome P450 n=1 Tax=Neosartorya fischeri (strain ATCC 1020 / DSM 3700 / CBS 544.65 / FGSC A1164 / JCM 1740 / NRRL 181 / WB 181) TaxID=331117 RepID=A1DBS0_NEOFI|nr:benzoate 4-monooxygenase cytochrome P450 [Aspergillus fischeri NRRL 181]EAW20310.1 benzoate 4-monooxygenase cytochrome P450 [Aspergillus fischeri NRRL 181]